MFGCVASRNMAISDFKFSARRALRRAREIALIAALCPERCTPSKTTANDPCPIRCESVYPATTLRLIAWVPPCDLCVCVASRKFLSSVSSRKNKGSWWSSVGRLSKADNR